MCSSISHLLQPLYHGTRPAYLHMIGHADQKIRPVVAKKMPVRGVDNNAPDAR